MMWLLLLAQLLLSCVLADNTTSDAYLFGFPLMLMQATRHSQPFASNVIVNSRNFPDPSDRNVVRPNVDTLYSLAWLDLSIGPLTLTLPDTSGEDGRFYIIQVLDAYTNVVASPGWRTTGKTAQTITILGPDFHDQVPPSIGEEVIKCPTNLAWVLGRTNVLNSSDASVALQQMRRYRLSSRFALLQPDTMELGATQLVNLYLSSDTPPEEVLAMSAQEFFTETAALMTANPPAAADAPLLLAMANYGLVPGEFIWNSLSAVEQTNWKVGLLQGKASIFGGDAPATRDGWSIPNPAMGQYGTDYLFRAKMAMFGLGANLNADATYFSPTVLRASTAYSLIFTKDQFPPCRAFWSLTMYDAQGYLVENTISRYSVSSQMDGLIIKPDGSVEIVMQEDKPSNPDVNWLPAPKSMPFTPTLRCYWPSDLTWGPPPLVVN